MEVSKAQKQLKIFAILSLISGVVALLTAVFAVIGLVQVLNGAENAINSGAATADDIGMTSVAIIFGIISALISGIASIVEWHFLKKAVDDAAKYKAAWVIAIFSTVMSVIALLGNLGSGDVQEIVNKVVALLINGYILYLVSVIRKAASE